MTDETGAPAGGDDMLVATAPADTPTEFSAEDAGRALAELRWKRNNPDAAPAGKSAVETPEQLPDEGNADPETAHGEEPDGNEPEETLPPIERPRSWSKDADDDWNSLPRARQEKIAENERAREVESRQRINDIAEQQKALKADREAAEKARQKYEAQLPALMQTLQDAQQSAFADIRTVDDVTKLANEDPFRYLQWQAHQTKLQAVNAELERAKGQKTAKEQSDWNEHVQRENTLAAELIPELADKDKGPALMKRAAERLSELGFKSDELNDLASGKRKLSLYDHRIQQLIFSDLKLSDIQSAKKPIAAKPLPLVQRPGTARPSGSAVSERIQALQKQFERDPSVENATALRVARLKRA